MKSTQINEHDPIVSEIKSLKVELGADPVVKMSLPQIEVYAITALGRRSYSAFYKIDGRKVVLKPKSDFSDKHVIRYLYEIKMQGIPYILGETVYQSDVYLVFSWLDGENISQAELKPMQLDQAMRNVLRLIEKLKIITGMNWFFLDLKPQHILIERNDFEISVNLIDYEHVVVSKAMHIPWRNFDKIGVSPNFCSQEICGEYLTKNHHEYALALIYLSLLLNKPIADLNQNNRKKALRKLPESISEKIESALNGHGFTPLPSTEVATEYKNSAEINKMSYLQKVSESDKINYNEHFWLQGRVEGDQIIETKELKIFTDIKFYSLCKCHSLPLISVVDLAFLNSTDYLYKKNQVGNSIVKSMPKQIQIDDQNREYTKEQTQKILQEISRFSYRLQEPNLLTKNLAQHIVKQCAVSDLFLSVKQLCLCKLFSESNLDLKWQFQEIQYGKFATEPELIQKILNIIETG